MRTKWPVVRIGALGEVLGGKAKVLEGAPGTRRKYLRVANVFDGRIDYSDVLTMPFTDAEFERFALRPNDILLNEGQSLELVGRAARYIGPSGAYAFQNSLIRFRSGGDCDPQFAEALFRHLQYTGAFMAIAARTTSIAHLGVSRFAAMSIALPPRPVQRQLAEVARVIEERAEILKLLLVAKRRLKRALVQRLCLQPEVEAESQRIGEVAQEVSERAGERTIPILSCTKHDGLVNSLEYFGRQVFSTDTSLYRLVRRNQFAYATNHIEEGSIGLLTHLDEGAVSPMYTVFECGSEVEPAYLFAMLKTDRYRDMFAALTSGSVNRRGGLRWDSFSKIPVRLPPRAWQVRAARVLAIAEGDISTMESLLAALRLQKRGVMQKLLSGEIGLPEFDSIPALPAPEVEW